MGVDQIVAHGSKEHKHHAESCIEGGEQCQMEHEVEHEGEIETVAQRTVDVVSAHVAAHEDMHQEHLHEEISCNRQQNLEAAQ